jgi:radical SAM protein with 4Fe4S-binding SPASM domain
LQEIKDFFVRETGMSEEAFLNAIKPCIENKEKVIIPLADLGYNPIPEHFLIEYNSTFEFRDNLLEHIDITAMMQDLDMKTMRHYIPDEITFMLNNICCTDCIYCYADKIYPVRQLLPLHRYQAIIEEAKMLDIRDISVDGGEFFLFSQWRELLQILNSNGYTTTRISTKHPITEDIVQGLVDCNVQKIQLSIDSVNSEELKQILKVDDNYCKKVLHGVELLEKAGIKIILKPVITKYNDSMVSINNYIEYFAKYKNIEMINFTPADFSQFKTFDYHASKNVITEIQEYIENLPQIYPFQVKCLGYGQPVPDELRQQKFYERSVCTGNVNSFFVLPDGKVTICEQMYWHPFFILGDLNKQSIMDMWNGEKALALWNFSQDEVREESPCKHCEEFEECRRGLGNCWRVTISAYGYENYDFPVPDCPKALPVTKKFYIP